MTQVDGFTISPDLVVLLKLWQDMEIPGLYINELLNIQDYLSRLLGENLSDLNELAQLSLHINTLVGIRDQLKHLQPLIQN